MKKKQIMKWINRMFTTMLFVLLISVALLVVITKVSGGEPSVFGYQLKTVLSGSMEPDIKTGSIIAVEAGGDMTRFKENDVITFREEDEKIITHRIIEVVESGENTLYRTKGDNNKGADLNLVLSDNVIAYYSGFTIPYVGYLISLAQSQNGAFLLLIPGILLLCYSGFIIWRSLSNLNLPQENKSEGSEKDEKSLSSKSSS